MKGLQLTRRGKIVGIALVIAAGGAIGAATASYAWDGQGYSKITEFDHMAPCDSDDGSGPRPCYWDASTRGDGQGTDFWVDPLGQVHN